MSHATDRAHAPCRPTHASRPGPSIQSPRHCTAGYALGSRYPSGFNPDLCRIRARQPTRDCRTRRCRPGGPGCQGCQHRDGSTSPDVLPTPQGRWRASGSFAPVLVRALDGVQPGGLRLLRNGFWRRSSVRRRRITHQSVERHRGRGLVWGSCRYELSRRVRHSALMPPVARAIRPGDPDELDLKPVPYTITDWIADQPPRRAPRPAGSMFTLGKFKQVCCVLPAWWVSLLF